MVNIDLQSSEIEQVSLRIEMVETEDEKLELKWKYNVVEAFRFNKFFFHLPATKDEMIWGGGEQYTYLNLREGMVYPIWVQKLCIYLDYQMFIYA